MHQEGPDPHVNLRPTQKRENAADQFRNEHIPPVLKPNKFCPEKVNQNHPVLADELAKRRWVKNPRIQL